MSARVSRGELLQVLEAVSPGLSPRNIIEQDGCFVFQGGRVVTYNEEVSCRAKSPLPDTMVGAVRAKPLLAILSKMTEDQLEVSNGGGELVVQGKSRKAAVRMEAEVTLPVEKVERPGKADWREVTDGFNEAVGIVQECAGEDETKQMLTCVHVHPDYLEATDDFQIIRYKVKTGVKVPILVKRDPLKHACAAGATHVCETERWVHFRTHSGLVVSCVRHTDSYPDLSPFLKVEGSKAVIPKGLGEAAERAEVFSGEDADENEVLVELKPGALRVTGRGVSGYYQETKRAEYTGPPVAFRVGPKMLVELTKRHTECVVGPTKIRVDGGRWRYVVCTSPAGGKPEKEAEDDA